MSTQRKKFRLSQPDCQPRITVEPAYVVSARGRTLAILMDSDPHVNGNRKLHTCGN